MDNLIYGLEQSADLSSLVYIDSLCSRYLGQTRHGHDLAGQGYDKACACGNLQVAYRYLEIGRRAQLLLVVGQAVLGLCYADRAVAKSERFQLLRLLLSVRCQDNSLAAVDLLYDLVQLILDASLQLIGEGEAVVGLFAETYDLFSQLHAAFAAFCPYLGQNYVYAKLLALLLYQLNLSLSIGRELVDGYYAGQLIYVGDIAYMLQKVRKSFLQSLQILVVQLSLRNAAVVLQGTYGRYDDNCVGLQACHTALDIQELLCSQVCAEACLGKRCNQPASGPFL